jgi:glutathione S-transferase
MLEIEGLLLDLMQHRAVLPEFARDDASYAERDELLLRKPLGVLNNDLNVASILVWGKMGRLDLSAHSNVKQWLDSCLARPAYSRVRQLATRN